MNRDKIVIMGIETHPVKNNLRPTDSHFLKVNVKKLVTENQQDLKDAELDLAYEKIELPKVNTFEINAYNNKLNKIKANTQVAIGANFDMYA